MGQQQLLLIVLGVIIVGVAIVAGIALFNAGAEEAAKDEIVSQCLNIGAHMQQWYKKPVSMGGGGLAFTGYVLPVKMSVTTNCGSKTTANPPVYTPGYVVVAGAQSATVTGTVNTNLNYAFTSVVATVTPDNITTVIN